MQETLEYIKQAFELKSQKCYKQAIEMLYKALEEENENTEILYQLGELYFLLNNLHRSLRYLEKVLLKNDRHIEALKILKKIYTCSENFQNACFTAEKIYSIEKTPENLIEMINTISKTKNLDKLKDLDENELKNDEVIYAVANAYYENKNSDQAKNNLKQALQINPENEDALVLLGKIYFDESEFEKSKNIFNSLSKSSENPEVLNFLGLFATEDMQFIDAIKYFSKASSIRKYEPRYLYNLANAYFFNGWLKEAETSYINAIMLAPDVEGYRYSLAYLYYEKGEFEKAQKEIDFILEHNTCYYPAHVLNALLKYEKKDFLGAQLELENTIKSGYEDNFALSSLAKVYTELSLYEKAENSIKKAIDNNPESLNYLCTLADIYISEENYEKAIETVEKVININENYICAYAIGAKAAYEMKDYDKTKNFAQQTISLDMNFAAGYYYLALVRFEEKDYEEAVECMKRAILYDVNNALYYAAMSDIFKEKGDYTTAFEYMKEAENISPDTDYRIKYAQLASLKRKANKNLTSE